MKLGILFHTLLLKRKEKNEDLGKISSHYLFHSINLLQRNEATDMKRIYKNLDEKKSIVVFLNLTGFLYEKVLHLINGFEDWTIISTKHIFRFRNQTVFTAITGAFEEQFSSIPLYL